MADGGAVDDVAVTGGVATTGDTVSVASGVDDFVVPPVATVGVLTVLEVAGSDTMVPPCSSLAATVNAAMATMALPPTTADSTLTRERCVG